MDFCSKNAFLSYEQDDMDIDTNIVSINFSVLKGADENLHQGDPNRCERCQGVLNVYSKVLSGGQYYNLYPEQQLEKGQVDQEVQMTEYPIKLSENEQCWICEFCEHHNKVILEPEEIPKQDDVTFMLEPSIQKGVEQGGQSIIFCIDNSGSMSTTQEIKGIIALKHGISNEEYELLKQFMEPGDEAQLQNHKQTTYVSRKQCVMAAIETQIEQLQKEQPQRLVGIVTFNDEVVVLGDGTQQQPLVIAGDKLNKYDEIKNVIEQTGYQLLQTPIQHSAQQLTQKFSKLQEKGMTALGPALLSSVLLAQAGQAGSKVIICTDGLANKGLGNIDEDPSAELFYTEVAQLAKASGVSISVITIKGEGCKLEILGKMAEYTAGNVRRVSPENIDKDFASILKDEVVGTNVSLQVRIHKALKFRGALSEVQQDETTLIRDIGNVTVKSSTTVEYRLKPLLQLQKEGVDPQNIKEIHIQSILSYASPLGDKLMRVFTKQIEATFDRQVAQKTTNYEILSKNLIRKTAHMIKTGDTTGARTMNAKWNRRMVSQEVGLSSLAQVNQISDQMNRLEMISNNRDIREAKLELLEKKAQVLLNMNDQFQPIQAQQQQAQIQQEKISMLNEEDEDMGSLFE